MLHSSVVFVNDDDNINENKRNTLKITKILTKKY